MSLQDPASELGNFFSNYPAVYAKDNFNGIPKYPATGIQTKVLPFPDPDTPTTGGACRAGEVCDGGVCKCPADLSPPTPGFKKCGGFCVNTLNDPDHCG